MSRSHVSADNGLYALRTTAGLSQQELADRMIKAAAIHGRGSVGVTANAVSRWERGVVLPTPLYRRLLAEAFEVTVDDLGLPIGRRRAPETWIRAEEIVEPDDPGEARDPRVRNDQKVWRHTRRALNAHRPELARIAANLYGPDLRIGTTGLISCPGWLPAQPVEIGAVGLTYIEDPPEPVVDGTEPEAVHVRPSFTLTRRYNRYSQAVRDLDPPRLFENRASWRLTDLCWSDREGQMAFGPTTYFAGVDTYEALAHELAHVSLDDQGAPRAVPSKRDLPFRRLIADPFDLARRPVLPSIDTLTIRRDDGDSSFLLHRRDHRRVAVAGGMLQVVPSGVFQPSSVHPGAAGADFDLWRNIMREFSEELLGNPEHDGDGRPARYDDEIFQLLNLARDENRVKVFCLGVALDALTLVGEILTVVVVDGDVFDDLAGDFVDYNDEGEIIKSRTPFTKDGVTRTVGDRIAPAGGGCLELAWKHRAQILGGPG